MTGKPARVVILVGLLLMAAAKQAQAMTLEEWRLYRNQLWRQRLHAPTPTPVLSDGVQATIMAGINRYRQTQGLAPVSTDPYTCAFARTRAQEIVNGFNHDGFTSRVNNHSLPYPSYSSVTENLAMTSDPNKVVDLWINSPGHAANMRRDTPYVCVERSGNYYAYEGWKP